MTKTETGCVPFSNFSPSCFSTAWKTVMPPGSAATPAAPVAPSAGRVAFSSAGRGVQDRVKFQPPLKPGRIDGRMVEIGPGPLRNVLGQFLDGRVLAGIRNHR